MTNFVVTQSGLEAWGVESANFRVTQSGFETWAVEKATLRVTQAGFETWASTSTAAFFVATQAGFETWASANSLVFNKSQLWQADVTPSGESVYVEAGQTLSWVWQTVLLPDNQAMRENAVVESNIVMAFIGSGPTVTVGALDTNDNIMQTLDITPSGTETVWGKFLWGEAPWGGTASDISPYQLAWSEALVFKQISIQASGLSTAGYRIGDLYINYQVLGYQQQTPSGTP